MYMQRVRHHSKDFYEATLVLLRGETNCIKIELPGQEPITV